MADIQLNPLMQREFSLNHVVERVIGDITQQLVHVAGGLAAAGGADDFGRHAGDRHMVGHVLQHDRARGDARAAADPDIAKDFRAGADQHAAAVSVSLNASI